MARHAEDIALALRVLAGPDILQQPAWRLELPSPRRHRLGEFRVAVWASSALCEIDASVRERFEAAVAAITRTGASVDENARPDIGDAEHHRLFMTLLRAATASRISDADFAAQKEIAATIAADDMSFRATLARGATLDHRAWGIANEARNKLRYAWRDFFQRFDVLLTPVAATAAFPHDHNPDRGQRLIPVNGRLIPYGGPVGVRFRPLGGADGPAEGLPFAAGVGFGVPQAIRGNRGLTLPPSSVASRRQAPVALCRCRYRSSLGKDARSQLSPSGSADRCWKSASRRCWTTRRIGWR